MYKITVKVGYENIDLFYKLWDDVQQIIGYVSEGSRKPVTFVIEKVEEADHE